MANNAHNHKIEKLYIKGQTIFGENFTDNLLFKNLEDKSEKPEVTEFCENTVTSCTVGTRDFNKDICDIYKLNIPYSFPSSNNKFRKAYGALLTEEEREVLDLYVPWDKCMPKDVFRKELAKYIRTIKDELLKVDERKEGFNYYHNVYKKHDILFEAMQPAKIHQQSFLKAITSPESTNRDILNGFAPDEAYNGYTKAPVRYLRNNTHTGRLKVADGSSNILTISKELRNQILQESRFGAGNGNIYYLDFKSLEPRVLLSLLSSLSYVSNPPLLLSPTEDDIYTSIIEKLGINGITRRTIKLAILMTMYGAGKDAIMEKLREQEKIENKKIAEQISSFVLEAFGIDVIKEHYCKPDINNRIYNYYGRPLLVDGVEEYKYINYIVQSTAVDVALFGFRNIILKLLETNTIDKIVPIFILHDALILDVHKDYEFILKKLASHGSKNIQGLEKYIFPIDVSKLIDNQ